MSSVSELVALFKPKFRTEYICLKCHEIIDEERRSCPNCGGPMCPRLIRVYS
jgi:rRNA maturation endonuclease Nob1